VSHPSKGGPLIPSSPVGGDQKVSPVVGDFLRKLAKNCEPACRKGQNKSAHKKSASKIVRTTMRNSLTRTTEKTTKEQTRAANGALPRKGEPIFQPSNGRSTDGEENDLET